MVDPIDLQHHKYQRQARVLSTLQNQVTLSDDVKDIAYIDTYSYPPGEPNTEDMNYMVPTAPHDSVGLLMRRFVPFADGGEGIASRDTYSLISYLPEELSINDIASTAPGASQMIPH